MNRLKLVAILVVLGIVTFVAMSSIYTVSEVEQAISARNGGRDLRSRRRGAQQDNRDASRDKAK